MVRYMRQSAGLSQEYLAISINVRKSTIERYEAGEITPTMGKFNEICYVCGYKVSLKKLKRGK